MSNCWGNGNSDRFVNNTCVSSAKAGGFGSDCDKGPLMVVSGNTVYNEEGSLGKTKICDKSNVVVPDGWPTTAESMEMAKAVLLW